MAPVANYDELRKALSEMKPDDPQSSIYLSLTPDLAEEILAHDPVNRPVRSMRVDQYARSIQSGRWCSARSQAMMFFPDGRLADGQHRCHAVLKAGTSIPVRVIVVANTYGVDEGIPRTLVDYLILTAGLEKKEAGQVGTVTRSIFDGAKCPTDEEMVLFFESNSAFILECVQRAKEWLEPHMPELTHMLKPARLASARAILIRNESLQEGAVDEFLKDVVNDGQGGLPGSTYAHQIHEEHRKAFKNRSQIGTKKMVEKVQNAFAKINKGDKGVNLATIKPPKKNKGRDLDSQDAA